MAVTVTQVESRPTFCIFDVIADADGDTTASFNPNFVATPESVMVTPLLTSTAAIAGWSLVASTLATSNISVAKTTTAATGAAANQVRVTAMIPHSII